MAGRGLGGADASDLLQETLPVPRWFVKWLLSTGCYVLAAKPKVGKSFFVLQLGVALVTGEPFMGRFDTFRTGVCIMELEDGINRAQRRLWRMADELPHGLRVVDKAERLDTGLLEQIEEDIKEHPDTGVYVIDTFAAVRPPTSEYSYQSDYDQVFTFTELAQEHDICILLVHHKRKSTGMGEDDFDDFSGTTGLTAGATGMISLTRDPKSPGKVLMGATSKEAGTAYWRLEFDDCNWSVLDNLTEQETDTYTVPDCVLRTVEWAAGIDGEWRGTTSDLLREVGGGVSAVAYGKYLAQYRWYMHDNGIDYSRRHGNRGSEVVLVRRGDSNGDDDAKRR
jgi:hypothetical protein